MSQNALLPDDPRLTAYALGELDPTEQELLEQLLFDSPQAQAAVREIRELAGLLTTELRQEPALGLTADQRTAILAAAQPATEAMHEAVNSVSNNSNPIAVLPGLSDPPAPLRSRRSKLSVKRFASLATIVALVVVLAVMIPPPRQRADLPMLVENGRELGETRPLGLQFGFAVRDESGQVTDALVESQAPPTTLALSDGAVRFPGSTKSQFGGSAAVAGGGTANFNTTSRAAAGLEPSQNLAQQGQQVTPGRPSTAARGLVASANKPNVPREGEPMDRYYFAPESRVQAQGSLGGRGGAMPAAGGLAPTGSPTTSPAQMGRTGAAGLAKDKKVAAVDQLRTDVRNWAFQAEGLAQSDPAAARALIENAEKVVKDSNGVDGQVTGKLLKSLAKSRESIDSGRKAGLPQIARRKSQVEDTAKPRPAISQGLLGSLKGEVRAESVPELGTLVVTGNQKDVDSIMEIARTIESTNKVGSHDPGAAIGALKRTLTTLESSTDIDSQVREQLRAKLQTSLNKVLAARDNLESERVARLERPSAERARELKQLLTEAESSIDQLVEDSEYVEAFLAVTEDLTGLRRKLRRDEAPGTEVYEPIIENLFFSAYEDPLSTFGVDVDTASYANVRRFLTDRHLPPPNAVRIEDFVNYFSYDYPQPAAGQPFAVNVEAANCPWSPGHQLVRIALKGREIPRDQRPASNLVFLVDVSGSMQAENKLPLVKLGLNLLTGQMTESDRVAIVTYSDSAVQRLESTNGTNKQQILQVIDSLQAGGSTNGAAGIQLAYRAALDHFIDGGTNRVILCTDGDFNVGVSDDDSLVQLIQERARTKVFFSVFGFGMGNLKDGKLEKLADKGNGHYAYIDGQREAHKMFVDELVGTLVTIAKDVKLQVEFNPNQVGAYRLIGYENRVMASQDFNNDKKDAGEVGAGHTVTALYEIVPAAESPKPELGDTLRYRKAVVPQEGDVARELLTVKLRYKLPEADSSTLLEFPAAAADIRRAGLGGNVEGAPSQPSRDFNWAAAVAAFGMILRDSQFRGQATFDMVLELAQGAKGEDKSGQRAEFIELVKTAKALCLPVSPPVPTPEPPVTLTREQAEAKASVNGKYRNLLRIVAAPGDAATYGTFHEFGRWQGTSYLGQNNLPLGHWVYVAPNWYIWGDAN